MHSLRTLPFSKSTIDSLTKIHPTPFYVYDEKDIRQNAQRLSDAFSWAFVFKNYFAIKATPNPYILEILTSEGFGFDCSSYAELLLAQSVGATGDMIMFTSNNTSFEEFALALKMNAIINIDDISHISLLEDVCLKNKISFPKLVCFRYNPGLQKSGNAIIGNPLEAKFGLTKEQLFEAYLSLQKKGVTRFGLHTMVASNELHEDYFIDTARMIFDIVFELSKKGVVIEFVNLGGGIGVPYKPQEKAVDIQKISLGIKEFYEKTILANNLAPLKIFMECGRYITADAGFLVTTVRHVMQKHKSYVGVDATMANLMRPGMYGAYHHIIALGKEQEESSFVYDVSGSLCENNDKFAIDRSLPKISQGDVLVICDVGAHGHSMGFQYNGKLRSAELLLKEDASFSLIRRAETLADYFSTLNFEGSRFDSLK